MGLVEVGGVHCVALSVLGVGEVQLVPGEQTGGERTDAGGEFDAGFDGGGPVGHLGVARCAGDTHDDGERSADRADGDNSPGVEPPGGRFDRGRRCPCARPRTASSARRNLPGRSPGSETGFAGTEVPTWGP